MTKFSNFIRNLGTAGPATLQGIYDLGFALRSQWPEVLAKYVRVDAAQTFTSLEKTQGRANIGAVIGTDVQAYSASLTSIAELTTVADRIAYTTGPNAWTMATLTVFGRSLIDDVDASAARTTLNLGTIATQNADNVAITGGSISGVPFSDITLNNPVIAGSPNGEFLRGHINGLTLSNNATDAANDIDIAAGSAASDGATPVLMTLGSVFTKRTDAPWAVGSGNGGWLDGASMPDGWGFAFLIRRSDTGVVDVGFSASTSPTLPAGYDQKRLIMAINRASGAIRPFTQLPGLRKCRWNEPVTNLSGGTQGTSATLRTVTAPPLPGTVAVIRAFGLSTSSWVMLISPTSETDNAPATAASPLGNLYAQANSGCMAEIFIPVNTSSQIRSRSSVAGTTLNIATVGFDLPF